MRIALLISTYNWPEALNLVFKSVLTQSQLPDEILIADDGSGEETRKLIEEFKNKLGLSVKHIWHEDTGFRKSKILNKAIAISKVDYIIQVDGDCILHKHFVKDHATFVEKNTFLYGSRVNILPHYVKTILQNQIISFRFFSQYIKNRTRALHIPLLAGLYKSHHSLSKKFRGCNVSFWKDDFIEVNGYNEEFEGWGREDSELMVRLYNNRVKGKRLRYAGIVFHIYHMVKSKSRLEENDRIEKLSLENKLIRCNKGISQYLDK